MTKKSPLTRVLPDGEVRSSSFWHEDMHPTPRMVPHPHVHLVSFDFRYICFFSLFVRLIDMHLLQHWVQ